MTGNVHFRCTFDVGASTTTPVGLINFVEFIVAWIRSKEGRSFDLSPNWLLESGVRQKGDGRVVVTTDSHPDDGIPELWALRYEHQDNEFNHRRWFTDFGIVRIEAEQWRISTTVSHSLHPNYIGREPGQLPVTPPRVIRTLLSSGQFRCKAGTVVLSSAPQVVQVGKADHFVRTITDPGRACPIVYVSISRLTGEPLLDPVRLASTILGTGVVFVAANPEIDDELEFLMIPREFRSPNGTVRVYAPGLDFRAVHQAYRHRFFTRNQIVEQSASEIEGQIARALTRRQAWAGVRSSVASIEDLAQRRREARRSALQRQSDGASKDELAKLFEEDNSRLSGEVDQLEKANKGLEERLDEWEGQIGQLNYEVDYYRTESEQLRKERSTAISAAETAKDMRRLPGTVLEVLQLMEQLHANRIVVTEEAKKSAQRATLDDLHVAWACLHAVATELPRLAFEESSKDLPSLFRSQTGFELSLTEGKMTKKDSALLSLREITFDDRQWNMSPHVKYGTRSPKCLRVHFALDDDAQRVIIGYCGDHMKTAGTRRHK